MCVATVLRAYNSFMYSIIMLIERRLSAFSKRR